MNAAAVREAAAAFRPAGSLLAGRPGAALDAGTRLLLHRRDLRRVRATPDPDAPAARELQAGEVRLQVAHVALTPHTVACARAGEALGSWRFFPGEDALWACLPAWGHAAVAESRHPELRCGQRVFGLLPMGTHLVVQPARCSTGGFADGAAHRAALPLVYSLFSFAGDEGPEAQARQALARPLFWQADRRPADAGAGPAPTPRPRWVKGTAAAEAAYLDLLLARQDAAEGVMLSLA